jgi:serine/threonine-protein kinase
MPREVETQMQAANLRGREQFLRYGSYALGSWLATIPFVVAMGVRAWPPILLTSALNLGALVFVLWSRKTRQFSNARMLLTALLTFATIASVTCWLGPFVLVPQACAAATLWIALACHTRRERWLILATGVLAVLFPFGLELLRVFPPAYVFENGNLVLAARALRLAPERTVPMLVYSSVTFVALPCLFMGKVRDALSAAEKQLFLQAWHLRQLLRDAPPKA